MTTSRRFQKTLATKRYALGRRLPVIRGSLFIDITRQIIIIDPFIHTMFP